jgi:hypothetical protein
LKKLISIYLKLADLVLLLVPSETHQCVEYHKEQALSVLRILIAEIVADIFKPVRNVNEIIKRRLMGTAHTFRIRF